MIFLMMAAHDTMTSSLTSLVWLLIDNPGWQEKLREEVHSLDLRGDELLPFEKLEEMPLTEMAFKEAMRINPPVPSIPRRALLEFEFGGFRIPAGTPIAINPLFTHHMSDQWPDPERFDPLRFMNEAQLGRHRFAWLPFSGGAHMCLGLHFAYMQAKCVTRHLLQNLLLSAMPGYQPICKCGPFRAKGWASNRSYAADGGISDLTYASADPPAAGVFASTAVTDAAYVFFNAAVAGRRRMVAANWSAVWYLLSAFAVISYTHNAAYVVFAAGGSWLGAFGSVSLLRPPPTASAVRESKERNT